MEALVTWLRLRGIRHNATPNGGFRHKSTAGKLKEQGVVSGFPDLTIWPPLDAAKRPILFIEMKRVKGGTVSSEQKEWIEYLTALSGFHRVEVQVCKGFEEARKFILQWGY